MKSITFEDIDTARRLLELPEEATMEAIKASYKRLIFKWHPDKCPEEEAEKCAEKTRQILAAYKTLLAYTAAYRYSFSEAEVKKYISIEDWWFEHFGVDPIWTDGDGKRK